MAMESEGDARSLLKRRRLAAILAPLAVIIAAVVIVLSTRSTSGPKTPAGASSATGAATVKRRNLIETDTESGTLSYSRPQTVYNRLDGTITWLPSVGQVIHPGQALYEIDNAPVTLMDGQTPAYRTLDSSDGDGPDIEQLNRNLVDLGFDPDGIVVDDVWQAATTDGVKALQDALGEKQTGSLALGEIVFLPGDQLISTVDGTLGDGGTEADTSLRPAEPEFVSLETPDATTTETTTAATTTTAGTTTTGTTTTGTTTGTTTTGTTTGTTTTGATTTPKKRKKTAGTSQETLAALLALLKLETAELKAGKSPSSGSTPSSSSGTPSTGSKSPSSSDTDKPASSGSGDSGDNDASAPGTAILQTTSTQLVVTVDLDATLQSEATIGEPVTVEMPAGNTVHGTVTQVSPVAQSSDDDNGNGNGNSGDNGNNSSGATIPVTVTLKGHQTGAGLDQAAVSVNFAQAKADQVLSVPVTALLATGGGNYAVQEATAPHKLIPVQTGLFAAGYVQISGSGIYSGLQVTDSQG